MSDIESGEGNRFEIKAGKIGLEINPLRDNLFIVRPTRVDQTIKRDDLVRLVGEVAPFGLSSITQVGVRVNGIYELLVGTEKPIDYGSLKSWGEQEAFQTKEETLGNLTITEFVGRGVWSVQLGKKGGLAGVFNLDTLSLEDIGKALVHIQKETSDGRNPLHVTNMGTTHYQADPKEHFFIFPPETSLTDQR